MFSIDSLVKVLHTLYVKRVQSFVMYCSPYTWSWNIEKCRNSLHASCRTTSEHVKNVLFFPHIALMYSFICHMCTGKHTSFPIKNSGKYSTIRSSVPRKTSAVLFYCSQGITTAESINNLHICILCTCVDVWHLENHLCNVTFTINWIKPAPL